MAHKSTLRSFLVLLVLSASAPVSAALTDHGDGTVTDSTTGLMWDKCSWGQTNNSTCNGGAVSSHTWTQALSVAVTANTSTYKGYADWRLPSRNELESLVKIDSFNPPIDGTAFPNTPTSYFWSSTTSALTPSQAWYVVFNSANSSPYAKSTSFYVRLVRGGQSYDSQDTTAPLLTSVGVSGTTSSGTTLAGTSDETATGYWIAVANGSTAPSAAEVEAATTYSGVTIVAGGNAAMIAASAKSFTVSGLTASTAYTIYLIAKDAAGNRSLVSSANVTTSAAADVTAPLLTSVGVSGTTSSGTALAGTSDETATGYWIAVANGSTAPSAAEIEAATTYSGVTIVADGNAAMTAASAKSFTVSGLTASTAYTIYLIAKDAAGNRSLVSSANVTTSAAADVTAPTLSAVSATATGQTTVDLAGTSNEGSTGYYVVLTGTGQTAPSATQVKAGQNSSGNTTGAVTSGNAAMLAATAKTFSISALTANTGYTVCFMAEDAATNKSSVTCKDVTTQAPASSGGGTTTTTGSTTTLPTGGGSAAPLAGQTVIVTENGKDGTRIGLPSPGSGTGAASNTVSIDLPGTGAIATTSTSLGTTLGVTHVTLPGTTTPVSTVTVDSGSASFTATKSGQAVAGLKNGIIVVSGSDNSTVTVDTSGGAPQIGVAGSDTIIVPKGTQNVSGTVVDLPAPPSGGSAAAVTVKAGDQTITVTSTRSSTTMTFQVVDIGGVKTPVLAITGAATVGSSEDSQPLVSVAGSVIHSGKSTTGSGGKKCNTIIQASSDSSSDVVHVVTCYIVLPAGTFSSLSGGVGNSFAAIKDGIVWAGETAEFDKNGIVTGAYLGTREGTSDAVGDDIVPGNGKFSTTGYTTNAFIPRLSGTPLRLNGAKLDESLFSTVNRALGTSTLPATPTQNAQGILTFQTSGDTAADQKALGALTFGLSADQVSIFPSRRIRVDTSRADGVTISTEGNVEVASGGLITTFVPTVSDPQGFAADIAKALPGSVSQMRWNGSWQVTTSDGTSYVGRPQWGIQSTASSSGAFSAAADGNLYYNAGGRAQLLFPDFYDYTTLQATFAAEFKDTALKVQPRFNGTAQATLLGKTYTLAPQWSLVPLAKITGKPAWWVENNTVYIKNADGTAQGFGVR